MKCLVFFFLLFLSNHLLLFSNPLPISNCCYPRQFQKGCQDNTTQHIVCSNPEYEDCCSIGWHSHCAEYTHQFTYHCEVVCGDGICNRKQGEACSNCENDCGFCDDQKMSQCSSFQLSPSASSFPNFFSDPLFSSQWHLLNYQTNYTDHPTRQFFATPNQDIHIRNIWTQENFPTGKGVTVAVVDDGLLYLHKDIQCNYEANLSYDFDLNLREPLPQIGNNHGTSCAGIISSLPNNNLCGVGIAMQSTLSGIRILGENFSDVIAARALSFANDKIDIYSNSWGPDDTGSDMTRFPFTLRAIQKAIKYGRRGLGNIFVWAGGNGRLNQDDSNYDELANCIFTIAVAASDFQGKASTYSERGANILINAPSNTIQVIPNGPRVRYSGISTIDRLGFTGYSSTDCASTFGGTSAATPVVSGVIALLLQVNPQLHWRDVQHVLIKSAEQNDPEHKDWKQNAANLFVNDLYGFGRVNAFNAVQMAKEWKSVCKNIVTIRLDRFYSQGVAIAQLDGSETTSTMVPLDLSLFVPTKQYQTKIEHVVVRLSASHTSRGELAIALQSPSGTVSILSEGRERDEESHFEDFPFMSVQFWDEFITNCSVTQLDKDCATWYLMIADKNKNKHVGTFQRVELQIYGTNSACTEEFYLRKESDEETPIIITPQQSKNSISTVHNNTEYSKQRIQWLIVGVFALIGSLSLCIILCITAKEQLVDVFSKRDNSYTLYSSELLE